MQYIYIYYVSELGNIQDYQYYKIYFISYDKI